VAEGTAGGHCDGVVVLVHAVGANGLAAGVVRAPVVEDAIVPKRGKNLPEAGSQIKLQDKK
jgi:hypothetical protein